MSKKFDRGYDTAMFDSFSAIVDNYSRVLTKEQMIAIVNDECSCCPETLNCLDCKVDTGEIDEYYMVKNKVWKKAGVDKVDILCIGCLEERIGRTLVQVDFKSVPLNYDGKTKQSDRLMIRLA